MPDLVRAARSPSSRSTRPGVFRTATGGSWQAPGTRQVIYHTGSNGGFRTIVFTKPSAKYAVVIFSNRTGIDLEDLIRVINSIYGIDDTAFVKLDSLIS